MQESHSVSHHPALFVSRPLATRRWAGARPELLIVFTLLMLAATIVPSSMQLDIRHERFWSTWFDAAIIALGMIGYLLACLAHLRCPIRLGVPAVSLLLLMAWRGIATCSELDDMGVLCLAWPICTLVFTPFAAWLVLYFTGSAPDVFLRYFALLVAAIGIVYVAAVVISPVLGLRAEINTRLGGPLGNAAMLQIVFLPAAAILLDCRNGVRLNRIAFAVCILALTLTFARATVISLGLYSAYLLCCSRKYTIPGKIAILTLLTLVAWGVAGSTPDRIERLFDMQSFSISGRQQSLETGLCAWRESPLFGIGYAHIWPFWEVNCRMGMNLDLYDEHWSSRLVQTEYGRSVWYPHSLLAYVGAEMGTVGLVLTALLFWPVVRACRLRSPWRASSVALLSALAVDCCTAGSFAVFPLPCMVWWLFCLAVLRAAESEPATTGGESKRG